MPVTSGPVRMCVVCRKRLPKAALLRLVPAPGEPPVKAPGPAPGETSGPASGETPGGAFASGMEWVEDYKQRMPGRGIYLCGAECRARFSTMKYRRNTRRKNAK